MAYVEAWDNARLKKELAKRLKQAKKYREHFETQWRKNEEVVFYTNSRSPNQRYVQSGTDQEVLDMVQDYTGGQVAPDNEMAINYAAKFLRFIHAQMSANPPSVIVRPTSTDSSDRAKADAGDRVWRHGYSDKEMPEIVDQANLKGLTYGTGYVKQIWDAEAGDTFEFDEKTDELTMAGDIDIYSPSTWDVWLDPNARSWRKVAWLFERLEMTCEEAYYRWPEHKDKIQQFMKKRNQLTESELDNWRETDDVVEIYFYVEKGLPVNGMAGRMCFCLSDGEPLGECTKNLNPGATLGFAIITDIDVPDQVYGKSFIDYIHVLQDLLNRLDTAVVDNVAAHGVVRMVLPQGAEIEDESLSNSSWDYVKISGISNEGPYFVPPAQLMPDIHRLRENLINGIQEMSGVNDALQGKSSREVSGFSLQTMIEAGNQTRRRLFNKFTLMVRDIAKQYLALVRENWKEPRMVQVLGKERAFEAIELRGADIDGGFDIVCEYGASLSLDPARRREEIMQLMPVFEKAGIPTKAILPHLKLNELEQIYDRMEQARIRQDEDFQAIIAGEDVEVRELQDHAGRLDYCYYFVETAEFKYLDEDIKTKIDEHIKQREQLAAQAATKGQAGAPGAAPGAPPMPGAPGAMPPPGAAPVAPPADAGALPAVA